MNNFSYHNPVRIVFGKGSIAKLSKLIPSSAKILITYGGGSIKKNGVLDQVSKALAKHTVIEFGGIEANPQYETLMKAVEICQKQSINFLLAVGGGSVLDGTKFIAAATKFTGGDPWKLLSETAPVEEALPIGAVLTLPATGSEMNCAAVVSRKSTQEKFGFINNKLYPQFSILDPETTFSLPSRQIANGVVDTFVHVMEQYMTYPVAAPLQDRQAEAIISTLLEEGPKALQNPSDYDVRANLMWCATQALNGTISVGIPQDWSSHGIGHELTAFYGLDHAQTLAVVFPGVCQNQFEQKLEKLTQLGQRCFGLNGNVRGIAHQTIEHIANFFESMGVPTHLSKYGVDANEAAKKIEARFAKRGGKIGEHGNLDAKQIGLIIKGRA